jgi:uncharacterized membrane protein
MASRIERMVENIQQGARGSRGGSLLGAAGRGSSPMANVGGTERIVSAVAGGLLGAWGLKRRGLVGWGAAALGAELVRRGATGRCAAYSALDMNTARRGSSPYETDRSARVQPESAVTVKHAETIDRPREELFAMWRDFSQLPQFMHHLERVDVITSTRSHWVAKGPAGTQVEWDAEIVDEREPDYIAWQAVEPAQVPNRGSVHFISAPNGRGTEVLVSMEAQPPAGKLGAAIASIFGKSPEQEVRTALRNFKEIAERGGFQRTGAMAGAGAAASGAQHGNGMAHTSSSDNAFGQSLRDVERGESGGLSSNTSSGPAAMGGTAVSTGMGGSSSDVQTSDATPTDPFRSQGGSGGWGRGA